MVIINGNTANASEVVFLTGVNQIYTSSGFDASQTNAGITSNGYEMTAITSANLINANYLIINAIVNVAASSINGISCFGYLTFQTKYTGGAYADSMTQVIVARTVGANHITDGVHQVTWIHTLTANEKANGVQVKIVGSVEVQNDGSGSIGASSVLTNKQATLEVKS